MASLLSSPDFSLHAADCPIIQLEAWNDTLAEFETAVAQTLQTVLPRSVGDTVRSAGFLIIRIAPRRFWVVPDEAAAMPAGLVDSSLGCSIWLGEGRVRLAMSGPRVADILAGCVALDWHSPAAAPGRALQASFHHISVLFVRTGETNCDLIVPRSFAQSISDWIAEFHG